MAAALASHPSEGASAPYRTNALLMSLNRRPRAQGSSLSEEPRVRSRFEASCASSICIPFPLLQYSRFVPKFGHPVTSSPGFRRNRAVAISMPSSSHSMTVCSAETLRILLFCRSGYTVNKSSITQNPSLQQWPPSHGNVDRPHTPVAILSKPSSTASSSSTWRDRPAAGARRQLGRP